MLFAQVALKSWTPASAFRIAHDQTPQEIERMRLANELAAIGMSMRTKHQAGMKRRSRRDD